MSTLTSLSAAKKFGLLLGRDQVALTCLARGSYLAGFVERSVYQG